MERTRHDANHRQQRQAGRDDYRRANRDRVLGRSLFKPGKPDCQIIAQ
jgi:hypothetical protein